MRLGGGKHTSSKHVDSDNHDHTDCYPYCRVDFLVPIADENRGSTQFSGEDNSPVVPIQWARE